LVALTAAGHDTLLWDVDPLRFPSLHLAPILAIALLAVPALRPLVIVPTTDGPQLAPPAVEQRDPATATAARRVLVGERA
jgi:hypothetical protein